MSGDGWEKVIGLADLYGSVIHVSFHPADADVSAGAFIYFKSGGAWLHCDTNPTVLRQLAGACLDAAEAVEVGC